MCCSKSVIRPSFTRKRRSKPRIRCTQGCGRWAARRRISRAFNIRTQRWDDALLRLFDIPAAILPEVHDNVADFGRTTLLGKPLTIGGMAGDQHAAMIGQACFTPGMVKSTYGTGCFALQNIGPKFKASKHKLLTTPAYRLNGETTYAVEGSIFARRGATRRGGSPTR